MKQREKVNQKKNKKSLSELWDNFEQLHTHVIGFPKEEEGEDILKKQWLKNFQI